LVLPSYLTTLIEDRLVHVLMSGVFLTGFLKDMLSLPRPLSPPLHRINMSGSAALEYGFPSTHSANAVSVAVYILFQLHSPESTLHPTTTLISQVISYFYMFSITLGRLYCGMHGFIDVGVGSAIGALVSVVECVYGDAFEAYLHSGTWVGPALITIFIFTLVRIHPEPVDDCPCFDDSVACAGVMVGVEIGMWHYASGGYAWNNPGTATVPFDFEHLGWPVVILRVIIGVLMIFAWRGAMKPLLLNVLPHLFRIIERHGLSLPRKFFMPASEYKKIPSRLRMDNVMPSVSDLPSLINSIRHPGRGRAVSIGPQSVADAYETLAYRDKRRRDSLSNDAIIGSASSSRAHSKEKASYFAQDAFGSDKDTAISSQIRTNGHLPKPGHSTIKSYEQMMGSGHVLFTPNTPGDGLTTEDEADIVVGRENELGETEIFSRIERPRRRFDVEVVTKLVVYAGIAWLAVEIAPISFELLGIGMGDFKKPLP
jgi:hypothetical protein